MHTRARVARLGIIAALVCFPAGPLAAQDPAPDSAEPRIVSVRVVTESGELLEENPAEIPARPGSAYSSEIVRDTLRQLYRTGRYADVRAEAADAAGGVRLDFVVRQNFYIDRVRIAGLVEPPTQAQALASLRLGLGQTFRESLLAEAIGHLRATLAEEGLYQAHIEHELEPVASTRQMNIMLRVTPGPRARLGGITVQNATGFPDAELLRRSKLRPGQRVTASRLERGAERLRKYLVKRGFLAARVNVRRGEHDPATNTLPLALEASAGARVRAEVTGVRISKGDLHKLLPIYQEGTVDEDLLQEGRRNIRDYLERDGYFDAQVRYEIGEDPERKQQVITYRVERGPRRRLREIAFEGNRYFSDELLRDRLRILPGGFLARGRFSQRLLRDDEEAIRELYFANGFREVRVTSEVQESRGGKEGDLFVRFRIEEGPQTRVAELRIEGNRAFSTEYLLDQAVDSEPGQPFSEFNVAGDRDNVLALYLNEGFPEARFDWEVQDAGEPHRVRLTYRIHEGTQVRIAQVLLSGHEFTRPAVIRREVQLAPEEPLREGDIVETQRRLYNLGVFSRVAIAPQNPEGRDPNKTVVVQVEEAKRYTIAYGFGIEVQRLGSAGDDPVSGEVRASPRGLFEVTRANFAGRAHTVAFKTRVSTLQSRALLSYTAPGILPRPTLNLLLTGLADRTRDVRTFTSTRYEASGLLEQRLSPFSSFLYRYTYRRVLVDPDSLRVSPDQIPLFSQPTKISAFGVTWIRDRRDNPADASRGNFNTLDFSLAARALGSSATFLRFFAQNSTFHPLGRRGVVFARSARIGIEEPLRESVATDVPLPERFFAGGGNSLRGFGLNQAGPRDPNTGFPIGGLAMLVFNQELRFPMRLPFVRGNLGGALFYDVGNVYERTNRISFRKSPPSLTDLNYLSHTVGVGFRYATPIGPVRLDLGYLLNPARFEFCVDSTAPMVPRCPMGQAVTSARLPRFQFFFNIGSIF
jgi:outer membrane protein assembly complex protein YaeT